MSRSVAQEILASVKEALSWYLILAVSVCKRSMKRSGKLGIFISSCLNIEYLRLVVKKRTLQWISLEWSRQKKHSISFSINIQTKEKLFLVANQYIQWTLLGEPFKSETCLQWTIRSWVFYFFDRGASHVLETSNVWVQQLGLGKPNFLIRFQAITTDAVKKLYCVNTVLEICSEEMLSSENSKQSEKIVNAPKPKMISSERLCYSNSCRASERKFMFSIFQGFTAFS